MTLTELSYYSRKYLPFIILFGLAIVILFYVVRIFSSYFESKKPKLVYTNPIFGKIQKPLIENATSSADLTFTLDTIEGIPTTSTDSAKVFFLPPSPSRFGYREKIYLIAKTLGFDTTRTAYTLEGKNALFEDEKQRLTIDISNFNFTYEYLFENNPNEFTGALVPTKNESETKATDFLKSIGKYGDEFARGKTNAVFLHYEPTTKQIQIVEKSKDANAVEVDFYRPDIDSFSIVSSYYPNSQNYVVMMFRDNGFKVLKAQVKLHEKSQAQIGTYPLKTTKKAYEELQSGGGYVIRRKEDKKTIVIKKIMLGYIDPTEYQEYLQPVYIFLGEENFVAYVQAVSKEYVVD